MVGGEGVLLGASNWLLEVLYRDSGIWLSPMQS